MGEGLMVVNRRGLAKRSVSVAQPISWVSKYGSVTYNQFGVEMPNAGMNEAGLVVEMLWLEEARYAGQDTRKEINVLQWIQYHLDTAATVQEVIKTDNFLRIAEEHGLVHFMVADKTGAVAVLEMLQGKLRVYQGADLPVPVLANDAYASCLNVLRGNGKKSGAGSPEWAGLPSMGRFAALAQVSDRLDEKIASATDFGFDGLARVRHPDFTQFQWVYDPAGQQVSMRRKVDGTTQVLKFADFDFSPTGKTKVADLTKSGELVWIDCTPELNRAVIGKSYRSTPFLQHVPDAALDQLAAVPAMFQAAN
jgi:choloylglycine hydrolase